MERREDVLRQAISKNADETERWQAFKNDNEVAMQNLDMFSKRLTVEVMVPIGKKALMPGELIHTNELLVGHYQGYFSACSAHKAKEICQHRLNLANEHLKKLEVEAELWQNKLETPVLEGAMPSAGEIEIVEEFDEESHKHWLRQHKESVRKQKQEERINREATNNDEDKIKKLEERDMLVELGIDPDDFNAESLNKFMNGNDESHETVNCDKEVEESSMTDDQVFDMLNKLEAEEQSESEADAETEQNLQSTNDLVRNLMSGGVDEKQSKPRMARSGNTQIHEVGHPADEEQNVSDDDDDDDELPDEVKLIREQLSQLPEEERVEFLKTQLQLIKSKMRKMQKENFISPELTHLMNVVVYLEDELQEIMFYHNIDDSTEDHSEVSEIETSEIDPDAKDNKKRRISFAQTDEKLLFRKNDTVAEMLHKGGRTSKPQHTRDVIQLDSSLQHLQTEQPPVAKESTDLHSSQVIEKVEQNLHFVKEHQSVQDFDLVNQILEAATGRINTLHIGFKHSAAVASPEPFDGITPGNPGHFYDIYERQLAKTQSRQEFPIYVNGFDGEQELKVPILKEVEREDAYDDPRAHFRKTVEAANPAAEAKSILRNKEAVQQESRGAKSKQESNKPKKAKNKKKPRTIDDELGDMSAFQKVMEDLVEKDPTEPEPLPDGQYINANAPKKRVSRFKEQRAMHKS